MNKNNGFEYFKIVIWTMLILTVLAFVPLLLHDVIYEYDPFTKPHLTEEENLNLRLFMLNKKEEAEPLNFKINYEKGIIYAKLQFYLFAKKEFEKTILKAPNAVNAKFELANCLVDLKQYSKALDVIKSIKMSGNKYYIYRKAKFCEKFAKSLYDQKKYELSYSYFKKAMDFYNTLGFPVKNLKTQTYICGVKYLDELAYNKQLQKALEVVDDLRQIYDTAILDYKKTLLLFDSNPKEALKFMERTYRRDYSLINFEVYRKLLENLIIDSDVSCDFQSKELYQLKLQRLNLAISKIFVLPDDFKVIVENSSFHDLKFVKNSKICLKILNNTDSEYKKLFLFVELFENDVLKSEKTINIVKSKKKPLKAGAFSKDITLNNNILIGKKNRNSKFKIVLKIAKQLDCPKTLVGTITLP